MGDVQREAEVLGRNRIEDAGQLFDRDAQIGDLRRFVDLVHVLDPDRELVFLGQLDDGPVGLDQAVEDMVHEEAEVVAEMENDVFGLELVGKLDIIDQVLLNGLADRRLDLRGIDERGGMEAVLHAGLVPQFLDAAHARGGPFVQKVVRVVAAQFDPGKAVLLGKSKVFFHGLRSGVKAKLHV